MNPLYPPAEADNLFIDGPVSISIHAAPEHDILEAFARLSCLVPVSAKLLAERYGARGAKSSADPSPLGRSPGREDYDRDRGPVGEGVRQRSASNLDSGLVHGGSAKGGWAGVTVVVPHVSNARGYTLAGTGSMVHDNPQNPYTIAQGD